jgi:hypothetical protein
LFYGGVDGAGFIPILSGECDDGAVGHRIARTIAYRVGFNLDALRRAQAFNAQVAGIGRDLLHNAASHHVIHRGCDL